MGLVVIGAILELVGVGLVITEVVIIRIREFGTPDAWTFATRLLAQQVNRSKEVQLHVAASRETAMRARAYVRPRPPSDDAPVPDRIAWLDRYVKRIDEDLGDVWQEMQQQADELVQEAERRDEELRQEMETREAKRREHLRPSLWRQGCSAVCVLVGLGLGTWGNLLTG